MYVNGVLAGQIAATFTPTYPTNDLRIGMKAAPDYDSWGGGIDDVRFYNRSAPSTDRAISGLQSVHCGSERVLKNHKGNETLFVAFFELNPANVDV